jgi:putative ABC transport system permease protein
MFKSYLKVAVRNLLRMKFFSFINIFGLSVGMAFCLIMLMYVVNEVSYDDFHIYKDRIFRVAMDWGQEGKATKFAGIFPAVGPALNEQFPEIEKAVRIERRSGSNMMVNDIKYKEDNVFFVEPGIFNIFSLDLIKGDINTVLIDPFSVVINQNIARKYFGNEYPVGKIISLENQPFKVTGILKDLPLNTHLNMEIMLSYSTLKAMGEESDKPWNSWGSTLTYFLLKKGQTTAGIIPKLSELLMKNAGDFMGKSTKFVLQKLPDIHFINDYRIDIGPKGNTSYLYIFLSASILILILGCFNYVNLTTSIYLNRMSEVGIRKVFGAQRSQLVKQFLTDSLLITLVSLISGILYKEIFEYLGTKVILSFSHLEYFVAILFGMIFLVGIIAGGYPSIFLSKFKPIDIIRKNIINFSTRFSFRKVMVVLQFTITIILLIGTGIIYRQLNFMKNSDLGFQKENVAIINIQDWQNNNQYYSSFYNELKKYSGIAAVSGSFLVPGSSGASQMLVMKKGSSLEEGVRLTGISADYEYAESLGLKIVQGRDFSRDHPTDATESVLINESAVKELKLSNPVGEQLLIPSGSINKPELRNVSIIGVVKDFHMKSKHQQIAPALISITPNYTVVVVRMLPQNVSSTIQYIKDTWKKIIPNSQININYLDDMVNRMYLAEEKIGNFLTGFAIIAIIISCLGLLGLTSFLTSRRKKEVGIRKVLGADIRNIVSLLSRQFLIWVLFANIISWPISYFLAMKWLENFTYRININLLIFALAGCSTLIIAILTLGYVVIKAASANPIDSLRYE